MAAVAGDLLRVVDTQTYLGQTVQNVFYFKVIDLLGAPDGYFEDVNASFEDIYLTPIRALQNPNLLHTHREWRNLSNNLDIASFSDVLAGTFAGVDPINSFTSAGFLLQRATLATRNGYKRFAGLDETVVSGNTYTGGATLTDNISAALVSDLFVGIIDFAAPKIIKRPIPVPAVGYVDNAITEAPFRGIGTQNTRKPGRGV